MVGGNNTFYLTQNASYDGVNWNRDDTNFPSRAIRINGDGSVDFLYAPHGANPITWSIQYSLSSAGVLTGSHAVIGTDPGGTESLRAQNLRANSAIFADMFSNTVVAGTDPGGTEALRAGSARFNAPVLLGSVPQFTMAADPTLPLHVATKQYVDSRPSGTIPDVRFLVQGNAVVANKVAQVLIGFGGTFTAIRAWADTAPTGAPLSIRINKNGVSVATLSIADGANSASTTVSIPVVAGDRISLDITGVGSITPGGNDLLVTLHA